MYISAIVFLIAVATAQAQIDTLWTRTYDNQPYDEFKQLLALPDGGFLVAGRALDPVPNNSDSRPWLIRTDADGNPLWNRTYGTGDEFCNAIAATPDGGFAFVGSKWNPDDSWYDGWLVRLDANGDGLWSRIYGGTYSDQLYSLVLTSDGGFVLAGNTMSQGNGATDFWVIRTDESGNVIWEYTFGGDWYDRCESICAVVDGGFLLTGDTPGADGYYDVWLIKINAQGVLQWERFFSDHTCDLGYSVQMTGDDGILVVGETYTCFEDEPYFYGTLVIKTDDGGNEIWRHVFSEEEGLFRHAVEMADHTLILGGYLRSEFGETAIQFAQLDNEGHSVWTRSFAIGPQTYGRDLVPTQDGGFLLGGTRRYQVDWDTYNQDYWLLRTTPILWADVTPIRPAQFALHPNFPNPFNSSTTISYSLPHANDVMLDVFDITGRVISTLVEGAQAAGTHNVHFDAGTLPSGIYIYRLQAGSNSQSRKLILLR